jgi:hypothetical protein
VVLLLENFIWEHPFTSEQERVSVTLVLFVEAAPPLIAIVPVGGVVSTELMV